MTSHDDLKEGTMLLVDHIAGLQEENPEIEDFHAAFEHYCSSKYSLGNSAMTEITGGKGDCGVDFYSTRDSAYHIGQCKIPDKEWLEANLGKTKVFGPEVIDDPRDGLRYLLKDSKIQPNDRVRHLYALIVDDRFREDFALTFYLIVYGVLDKRAEDAFVELKQEYQQQNVRIILQQVEDLIDEFLVGTKEDTRQTKIELHCEIGKILSVNDYCYCLVNAGDLFRAFKKYGWSLFDLNVRYELKNSPVNNDIVTSLSHPKSRKQFHHYNNGLVIVAKSYSIPHEKNRISLTGAQIVNGLQTVKSIYNAVSQKEVKLDELDEECVVQVKVIRSSDAEFVSKIVQSTNNQNPMAIRNLKANGREQQSLRKKFVGVRPRWFLQIKQGEWTSLTQEGGIHFKPVVGFPPSEFKPNPSKSPARIIDNQDAAKSWLAFCGFSDHAAAQVAHYFNNPEIYKLAFIKRPNQKHWKRFADLIDFNTGREDNLENEQGTADEYLLAYFLWQFAKCFVPSPQSRRESALRAGVEAGKIDGANGEITSSQKKQDEYLAEDFDFQTWRLMDNMKEVLVEVATQVLARKYGPLDNVMCSLLLSSFDGKNFLTTANVQQVATHAASAKDLSETDVFARIFCLLRFVCGQYWEDKQKTLASSRLRLVLVRRDTTSEIKRILWETNERKRLDRPWKQEGKTFLESLPNLSQK